MVSLSRYRYANKYDEQEPANYCCDKQPCCETKQRKLSRDEIVEEVNSLRESLDNISLLLYDITVLSNEVTEAIDMMDGAVTNLKDQLFD